MTNHMVVTSKSHDSPMGMTMGERVSLCLLEGMSMVNASTLPWLVPTRTLNTDEWPGEREGRREYSEGEV